MQTQTLRFIVFSMLTIVVMLYFYTSQQKTHYQRTALPAVKQILMEISSWDKQVWLRHLAPETKQVVSDAQLDALLDQYRQYGRFRSLEDISFSRTVSAFALFGQERVNYSGTVNFDAGLININITLVVQSGLFLIYNIALTKAAND